MTTHTYEVHAADSATGETRQRLTGPHATLYDAYRALPGKRYPEGVLVIRSDGRTVGAAALRDCVARSRKGEHLTAADVEAGWELAEALGMTR